MTTTKPRVYHRRNAPSDAVYIGRPSRWGNPYHIGRDGDRATVISRFRAYLDTHPELVTAARLELRGRDLACYCAPLPCHGDIWIEVANG